MSDLTDCAVLSQKIPLELTAMPATSGIAVEV